MAITSSHYQRVTLVAEKSAMFFCMFWPCGELLQRLKFRDAPGTSTHPQNAKDFSGMATRSKII